MKPTRKFRNSSMAQLALVLLSMMMAFTSCKKGLTGEGPTVTQMRNITGYEGLDVRIAADVFFQQDNDYSVKIQAQQNILDVMETYVSNNVLVIKFKNDVNVRRHDDILITITGPHLNTVKLNGSGDVTSIGSFNEPAMWLELNGSGNINISELHTPWLQASLNGSGNINVGTGDATETELKISGSGDIDVANVISERAKAHISGSGSIWAWITQTLDVKISGSGSVHYRGQPVVTTSISGSGKVKPI